jgi:hypothetical protein
MSSQHESRFSNSWNPKSLNPASNGAPIDCTTSIHSTQPYVNVPHAFILRHQEFNYSSLFVTCVRHRRHFHRLLQRRYLSDDRVLINMCAINISVATSQFSLCYLYSGMSKKMWGINFWATYVYRVCATGRQVASPSRKSFYVITKGLLGVSLTEVRVNI